MGVALAAWSGAARADATAGDDTSAILTPSGPHALGRVIIAGPAPEGPTVLSSAGYGYTESALGMGDAHHRVAGALTIDERPAPWLDLALRLDGRYDAHVLPGQATDTGMVGDPRIYVRVDHALDGGLRLGARGGLWLPGRNAPSLDGGALSPELVGLASYAPAATSIHVSANLGYRLDRSAHSAPDAALLGPGDRLALEVSSFDEVLVGVATAFGRGRAQGFVEASADLLVGAGAPPLRSSPMFVGAGGRLAVGRNVALEAEVEVSPSSRPETSASAPLVPIPPRFAVWLGLTYHFGAAALPPLPPPPSPSLPPPLPVVAPPPPVPAEDAAASAAPAEEVTPKGQIRGLIRSLRGAPVAAEIRVESESGAKPSEGSAEPMQLRAEGGRFEVDVAPGRYRVTISAPGYQEQQRKVEVEENGVTVLNVDLRSER